MELDRERPDERSAQRAAGFVGAGLGASAALFAVAAVATTPWLFIPAAALAAASGIALGIRALIPRIVRIPQASPDVAHIGLGAEVHASAVVEPGGVVEMGATLKEGSRVRSGALVRMGATIGKNAEIESRAVVGWGATIHDGARVCSGASVGAGATVKRGAVVESGAHVGTGATFGGRSPLPASAGGTPQSNDPRARRIDELCDRLGDKLAQASTAVREFLGNPEQTVQPLRRACHDLLRREQGLRREVTPEILARLDQERSALEARMRAAADEHVRTSLAGALAALDEQLTQRRLLARNADRLEAELTRLLWTTEGLISQTVRVQSEGNTPAAPGIEHGLRKLRDELGAVSEALEAVNRDERAALQPGASVPSTIRSEPVAPISSEPESRPSTSPRRTRT